MPEIAQFTKTLRLPETVTAVCAAESVVAPFPWKNSIPEIRQPFADRVNRFANEFDAAAFDTRDMFLAFAEGRFLTVHPFQDFNGRVIRLFLSELLRRLDLPPVRLEAEGESERAAYFAALEAADQNDLRPLVEIWKQRLAAPETPTA